MTGAIEFMRAWRDICNAHYRCRECPLQSTGGCKVTDPWDYTDEGINNLITAVMAEKRRREEWTMNRWE